MKQQHQTADYWCASSWLKSESNVETLLNGTSTALYHHLHTTEMFFLPSLDLIESYVVLFWHWQCTSCRYCRYSSILFSVCARMPWTSQSAFSMIGVQTCLGRLGLETMQKNVKHVLHFNPPSDLLPASAWKCHSSLHCMNNRMDGWV